MDNQKRYWKASSVLLLKNFYKLKLALGVNHLVISLLKFLYGYEKYTKNSWNDQTE